MKTLCTLVIFALLAGTAAAGNFSVANTNDTGAGSLRDAITQANTAGGTNTITFDSVTFAAPGPYTIQLAGVLPDLNNNLTITGPGANILTVRAEGSGNPYRIFKILSGNTVSISGLTISNGYFQGANGAVGTKTGSGGGAVSVLQPTNGAPAMGGGIYNSGDLSLTDCVLDSNVANGGSGGSGTGDTNQAGALGADGFGGAIYSDGTGLSVARCTFSSNSARGGAGGSGANIENGGGSSGVGGAAANGRGGAIYIASGGASFSNSTFSANGAYGGFGGSGGASNFGGAERAGGVGGNAEGGAIYASSSISLTSCTVALGFANAGNGGYQTNFSQNAAAGTAKAGGLYSGSTITIGNTLVAGNTSTNPVNSTTSELDVFGTFSSQDFNLIAGLDGTATGFNGAADLTGTLGSPIDAKLGASAADNGGPTTTLRLRKNSPALDKGKDLSAATKDQRNLTRPVDLSGYANATGGDGSDIGAFEAQTAPNDAPTTNNQTFSGSQGVLFDDNINHKLTATDPDGDAFTFVLVSGTMPAGLTLNSDGTVTGTPTAPSQAVVTFKATDGTSDSANATLTFNIVEAKSLVVTTDIDNSTAYDGLTSFREAVNYAASSPGTITFDSTFFATAKTITLTSNLGISSSMSINGSAAGVTISGGGTIQPIAVFGFSPVTLNLKDLTFANGFVSSGSSGGAFIAYNFGSAPAVTFTNCTFSNNGNDDITGGAISNSGGTLTLNNCTFSGNHADDNSTTNSRDGAMYQSAGSLTIVNCTLANNHSNGTGAHGGAININGGTLSMGNSIVAGNLNTGGTSPDIAGTVSSQGYNIIGNTGGTTVTGTTTGNQLSVDPLLDAGGLASNGGPTQTIALQAASPAIDQGKALGGATTDQRGSARPSDDLSVANAAGGDGSDIGAFEVLQKSISITADQAAKSEGTGSGTTAFTFTITRVASTSGAATVDYAVTGSSGSPADAADFGGALPSGTFTIPDTQASAVLTINVSKDVIVESDEGFTVTLSNPAAGYSLTTSTASSTITNDDAASATSGAATAISTTTATLNGVVNANGASTTVSFDYGTTNTFGTNVAATPPTVNGTADTPISLALSGLTPNTTYFFRVKAVNSGGTTNATDLSFTTLPPPPTATTSAATAVTSFTATLNGSVNANGAATAVTFEYGTTTSYGTTVTATESPATGSSATAVSAGLTQLLPNTTYHFRVNAVSSGGTANGTDQTFTTADSSLSISSGPTATPSVAGVGQTVTFSVAAADTAGNTLIYSWDIAGTASSDASPTRVFTSPGTYTATVTVTTSVGGSVSGSVSVTVKAPVVGTGNDSDGDGFSDDFEIASGTSPLNASDSPTGGPAPVVADLVESKLSIKLNFAKPGFDSIGFVGTLPIAAGFNPASKTAIIDVGGVVKSITLDAKGKSPKGDNSFKLTVKAKKGVVAAQTAKYSVKLTKGSFATSLSDEGLTNADATKASVNVLVRIVFAGAVYEHTQALSYTAKKGKSGSAK